MHHQSDWLNNLVVEPIAARRLIIHFSQEGSSISRQNLNENLKTLHIAPTIFYHLPGFYLKTEFLNPHSLSLHI